MARNQDKSPKALDRRMTVSQVTRSNIRGGEKTVASIRLTGLWLENLGFEIGQRFLVRESPGRLELVADWVDQCGLLQEQDHGTNS